MHTHRIFSRRSLLLAAASLTALLVMSCTILNTLAGDNRSSKSAEGEMDLSQAMLVTPENNVINVMDKMGAPDAFTIRFDMLEDRAVRWETWSYFDYGSSIDFVDGELLWMTELEPVPDGSLYAHLYDPDDFGAFMSPDLVRQMLFWQQLEEIHLSEGGLENGMLLAGDQILLGFDQDRLVYVETFVLSPEDEVKEADQPTPQTPAAEPQQAATDAPAVGTLLFEDGFKTGTDQKAIPLFPPETMVFHNMEDQGWLVSYYKGGIVGAAYETPLLQDFIAEFEVTIRESQPGSMAGFLFRGIGGDQFSRYYNLVIHPGKAQVGLEAWKDGEWVLTAYQPIPAEIVPEDGNYRLRIEVRGARFGVSVNGTQVAAFTDDQLPEAGRFGFTLATDNPPAIAKFDNLRIYQLP